MPIHAFSPGDVVPATGSYWVSHSLHRVPHVVQFAKGDIFPPCKWCTHRVLYEFESDSLVAARITDDADFRP